MESCQILWKRGPGKQSGVKKQMNQRRKHSESGIRKSSKRTCAISLGASWPKAKATSKRALSSRNGGKSPQKSFGGVDSRPTTSMQVVGYQLNPDQVLKSPSCPTLKKKRASHRPHTSLGFTWNKPSAAVDPLGPPRGFDIAGYVKRCGTAQGIQIGINGRPVNDEYFQMYLEKCERDVQGSSFSDSDEEFDLSYLGTVSEGKLLQRKIPLCWEDQLKIAEPECIMSPDSSKPKKKCIIVHQQSRTSRDLKISPLSLEHFETEEDKIEQIISKASVTLSWRESCILTGTPLYELNPSLLNQSSDMLNAAIDRGKDSTAAANSDDCGSTAVTFGDLAEWLRQNKGTEEQEGGITSETNIDIMSEYSSDDLLGIWFKTEDCTTQKMLVKLSFEVFVTATETVGQNLVELSTKAFTKLYPRIVSSTVLMIPIHLCGGESTSDFLKSKELKLTVICDEPRSLLFSTRITLPTELDFKQEDFSPGNNSSCKPAISCSTVPGPMKHRLVGSLEVPEHFCKRRTSYCDQDEDEDKTDLEALTRLFPDLKVVEYRDSTHSRNDHSTAPASLPVHEDELMRLNSIAVNIRRNPTPSSTQIYGSVYPYGMTNQTSYARQTLNSNAGSGWSNIPRPLFRPVTHQDIKATAQQPHTSYTSIVSSWLTPYMK